MASKHHHWQGCPLSAASQLKHLTVVAGDMVPIERTSMSSKWEAYAGSVVGLGWGEGGEYGGDDCHACN